MASAIPMKLKSVVLHGAVIQVRAILVGVVEEARPSVALWTLSLSRTVATGQKDGEDSLQTTFKTKITTPCSDNKRCAADKESVAHAFSINNNACVVELPPLKRRGDELFSLQSRASSGGQNYCCKKTKKAFGEHSHDNWLQDVC